MRRVRRYILNALTVLSLLLCVATAALWVRSYRVLDSYQSFRPADGRLIALALLRGGLQIAHGDGFPRDHPLANAGWESIEMGDFMLGPPDKNWQLLFGGVTSIDQRLLGFRYLSGYLLAGRFWSIQIPLWSICTLLLLSPMLRMRSSCQKWQRREHRLCLRCGYDLRATPDRCPECGTPVTTPID